MTTPISRDSAVKRIADHLADRDAYVITVPPDLLAHMTQSLKDIAGWTAYLDNGTGAVLSTRDARVPLVVDLLIETATVVTIPKTVPAAALSKAVRQDVPADGSQDIVILGSKGAPYFMPLLFVDALQIIDPGMAAAVRASHLSNLS